MGRTYVRALPVLARHRHALRAMILDDRARTRQAVAHYREHGWARLGRLADEATLDALRARADAIMLGEVTYPGLFFQHDSETGRYEDLAYGKGWKGPSLEYRKVEKLEKDPLFWAWLRTTLFARVARARLSSEQRHRALPRVPHEQARAAAARTCPGTRTAATSGASIAIPTLQIWTALDDAPARRRLRRGRRRHARRAGSRRRSAASSRRTRRARATPRRDALPLPGAAPARCSSSTTTSGTARARTASASPRRALSVCYMSAATRCRRKKRAPRSFLPRLRPAVSCRISAHHVRIRSDPWSTVPPSMKSSAYAVHVLHVRLAYDV